MIDFERPHERASFIWLESLSVGVDRVWQMSAQRLGQDLFEEVCQLRLPAIRRCLYGWKLRQRGPTQLHTNVDAVRIKPTGTNTARNLVYPSNCSANQPPDAISVFLKFYSLASVGFEPRVHRIWTSTRRNQSNSLTNSTWSTGLLDITAKSFFQFTHSFL